MVLVMSVHLPFSISHWPFERSECAPDAQEAALARLPHSIFDVAFFRRPKGMA